MKAEQQDAARYETTASRACKDDVVIADALKILQRRATRANYLTSPKDVQQYLTVALSER